MSISKRNLFFIIFYSIFLAVICTLILNSKEHIQTDFWIVFSFAVNITVSFIALIFAVKKYAFGFNFNFWLFNLFFFGIVPLLQFYTDTYFWGLVPTYGEIFNTNLLITLWYALYIIGYNFHFGKVACPAIKETKKECVIREDILKLFAVIAILITIYNLVFIGLNNLLFRDTNTATDLELNQTQTLIIEHGFKNFLLFNLVFNILQFKNDKSHKIRLLLSIFSFVICCFPTGIPRNMMASFYGGLLIIIFSKLRGKNIFPILLILGLVLIFPIINLFRYSSNGEIYFEQINNNIQDAYLQGDFDAHQMFISVQRLVEQRGLYYGSQLLGALLFFVPRGMWSGKPLGTGYTTITELNQFYFKNVSAPFISEWYVNFGIIGMLLAAFLLGYLIRRLDHNYWKNDNELSFIRIIFPFSMLMFFFMLRGDMLSTWAYTFAQIVVGYVMWKIAIKRKYI